MAPCVYFPPPGQKDAHNRRFMDWLRLPQTPGRTPALIEAFLITTTGLYKEENVSTRTPKSLRFVKQDITFFSEFCDRYRSRLLTRLEDARPFFFTFKRILMWAERQDAQPAIEAHGPPDV